MSPAEELAALYEQWRCLTEEEGQAIDDGDWNQVSRCQSAKTLLQPRIIEVSQRIEMGVQAMEFRPVVAQLMELENANRARLQHRRTNAENRKLELDRSSRQLRQLHQFYARPARTNWESYS